MSGLSIRIQILKKQEISNLTRKLKSNITFLTRHEFSFATLELGWDQVLLQQLSKQDMKKIVDAKKVLVLYMGNDSTELDVIQGYGLKNVWVWLYGDETFSLRLNFQTLRNKSIAGVIRPYPLYKTIFIKDVLNFFKYYLQVSSNEKKRKLKVKYFVASFIRVCNIYIVALFHKIYRKSYYNFYPGYTNLFALSLKNELSSKELSNRSSLILNKFDTFTSSTRYIDFCFMGQSGSPDRKHAINQLRTLPSCSKKMILERQDFGGSQGTNVATRNNVSEYITALRSSKFSICPSGNYSGATFRWLESIALGSVPMLSTRISSDPAFQAPGNNLLATFKSWDELFQIAEKITEPQRIKLLENLVAEFNDNVESLNELLLSTTQHSDRIE
jgi:hypothetical protein